MSLGYRWEFSFTPVEEKEVQDILDKVGYNVDSHDLYVSDVEGEAPLLICWGEGSISGGIRTEDRHEELVKLFPDKKVVSRWRCTEYDEWDDTYGESDA